MSISGNLIGLDIGQSHITAVRMASDDDGTLTPLQILEVGLPRSTFGAGGELLRPEIVADGIKHLRAVKGLKAKKAVIALPGSVLSIQPVVRPNTLWGEDLNGSVRIELEPGLPYDRDQAHITSRELERDTQEGGTVKVLTVAVNRNVPEQLAAVVKKGGLQVVDILPAPIVLPRAIAHGSGTEVVLSVGMLSSSVMSITDGQVNYAQTIPLGSDHFTGALVGSGFQPDEAERWKKTHSLVAPEGKADPYPDQRNALKGAADSLVESVYQVMTYDASEGTTQGISRLVITGGGSLLSGLGGYLSSSLGLPVELAEPHPLVRGVNGNKFSRYALAMALAMTDEDDLRKDK